MDNCTELGKEYNRRKNEEYRHGLISDYNLLRECVPGTTRSSRRKLLKKTVNYIQELQKKIKELEKELLKKKVNYIEELQKKIKELETSQTPPRELYPSEPVKTFAITLMKKITSMDAAVQTTSQTPEEVRSAEKELLVRPEEELLASPEFNTIEEFGQWLKMKDMTPSKSPEKRWNFLRVQSVQSGQKI
jgi:Fe2+ transport system protein B